MEKVSESIVLCASGYDWIRQRNAPRNLAKVRVARSIRVARSNFTNNFKLLYEVDFVSAFDALFGVPRGYQSAKVWAVDSGKATCIIVLYTPFPL